MKILKGLFVLFLLLGGSWEIYADEDGGNRRRDPKKKYVNEVESGEKRYVGDVQKDEIEDRRRRGVEKRYVGDESEDEFFKREKEALYEYDIEEGTADTGEMEDAKVRWETPEEVVFKEEKAEYVPEEAAAEEKPAERERGKRAEIPKIEMYEE